MTPPMLRQLRHDLWATEKLIAHCRTLTKDQLALSVPGTYGSIRKTLSHIVRGDERYLVRLGITRDPTLAEDHEASLDEVAAHLARVKAAVEGLFTGSQFDPDRVVLDTFRRVPTDPPLEIDSWTMLVQFTHHGSDHRAHIGTILGAHGLPTPDLDVWAYGRETGAIRERRGEAERSVSV
jgi:uncharacterized damage-inducible protein DinB